MPLSSFFFFFAHAHVTREDSSDSITCSNLKRYEMGHFFWVYAEEINMTLLNVSECLNSEVSSCHLENCASFAFLVLYVISGFSVLDIENEKTH